MSTGNNSVLMGDTIKLEAKFKDFPDDNGVSNYVDPENIVFKVFNESKKQIGNEVSIGMGNRKALGVFEVLYTIPDYNNTELPKSDCKLYPEFTGLVNGTPIKSKCEIIRKWNK